MNLAQKRKKIRRNAFSKLVFFFFHASKLCVCVCVGVCVCVRVCVCVCACVRRDISLLKRDAQLELTIAFINNSSANVCLGVCVCV